MVALVVGLMGGPVAARGALEVGTAVRFAPEPTAVLSVRNPDAEAVSDLIPELGFLAQRHQGAPLSRLDAGAQHEWTFSLPPPPAGGTLPITTQVTYRDAAGTAATALQVDLVQTPGASAHAIPASLVTGTVARLGHVRFVLDNPGTDVAAGRARLALPPALHTDPESLPVQVPPGGRATVPFVVENVAAPLGAEIPVHALFEYEQNGLRECVLRTTTVRVVASGIPGRATPLLVGLGTLLGALAGLALAWRAARARAAA